MGNVTITINPPAPFVCYCPQKNEIILYENIYGWAPGYKIEVLDRPRWTEEGWKLHLEVYGDYVEGEVT